jgi:hypothetical protein
MTARTLRDAYKPRWSVDLPCPGGSVPLARPPALRSLWGALEWAQGFAEEARRKGRPQGVICSWGFVRVFSVSPEGWVRFEVAPGDLAIFSMAMTPKSYQRKPPARGRVRTIPRAEGSNPVTEMSYLPGNGTKAAKG